MTQLPINSAERNAVWVFPKLAHSRFPGAPPIIETTRTHEMPNFNNLLHEADISVELYGNAVSLWLDAERRRVYIRRFHFVAYPSYEAARDGFRDLWQRIRCLESIAKVEAVAEKWYDEQQGREDEGAAWHQGRTQRLS